MLSFTSIAELRVARNQKLKDSDFLILSDIPLTPEEKTLVLIYRQALRDLPAQFTDDNVGSAILPVLSGDKLLKMIPN